MKPGIASEVGGRQQTYPRVQLLLHHAPLSKQSAMMTSGKRLCRRNGIPGGANHSRALSLYEEAAERGDVEGMTALAWMHAAGLGSRANVSRALELYWSAVERAPDASYAAAPFLAFWWLRARVALGWGPGGGPKVKEFGQDVTNICVLLGALWLVLWLRRTRSANAGAQRQ